MIYYFSGTGNSRYAAEKLAKLTDDKCVNMAAVFKGQVTHADGRTDVTGFVFPVYYSGLPEMVKRFASHHEIKSHLGKYVYCVITCGAETAAADKRLEKCLERKIDYSASLRMPDNYVIMYDPSPSDKAIEALRNAENKVDKIADDINKRRKRFNTSFKKDIATALMYPLYNLFRTTRFYKADSNCTSCGLCEKVCPDDAIKIENGKPVWIEKKCQHCTACINRCPEEAIQFTSLTKARGRYYITKLK